MPNPDYLFSFAWCESGYCQTFFSSPVPGSNKTAYCVFLPHGNGTTGGMVLHSVCDPTGHAEPGGHVTKWKKDTNVKFQPLGEGYKRLDDYTKINDWIAMHNLGATPDECNRHGVDNYDWYYATGRDPETGNKK